MRILMEFPFFKGISMGLIIKLLSHSHISPEIHILTKKMEDVQNIENMKAYIISFHNISSKINLKFRSILLL